MLQRVSAVEFRKEIGWGKTRPAIVMTETDDGDLVETVVKFAANCERGPSALAIEVMAACLAADLGLPIPEPKIVEISPEWRSILPAGYAAIVPHDTTLAFGSRLVTGQWPAWSPTSKLTEPMVPMAAAIFVFDALIDNADRRTANPNCLSHGEQFRIFDHEMAWTQKLFGQKPWHPGGLSDFSTPGNHIFRIELLSKMIDYAPIRTAWGSLQDERIAEYGAAVPPEWRGDGSVIGHVMSEIQGVRDQIDGCLDEVRRVLQ